MLRTGNRRNLWLTADFLILSLGLLIHVSLVRAQLPEPEFPRFPRIFYTIILRQSVPAYKVFEHKKMIMIFHQIFKKKMHQIFSVRLGFWCYFVRLYQKMGQEIAISSQENYLLMISQ